MRRAPVYVLLAFMVAFFASCADRNPAEPGQQDADPSFSFHLSECWPDDVVGQIEALFPDSGIRTAALAMFDNILQDVERGALREAETKADAFARFVGNKENKLGDPCGDDLPTQEQAQTVLIGNVYAVATGGEPLVIPPEAYGDFGGVGLIDPATGGVVTGGTEDVPEAAVVADENAFDGTGLVMIVLTRLFDPDVNQPPGSGPIPGFQAYPEGWDITSSRQLTPEGEGGSGAIVELCVLTDDLDPAIDARLVIGHDLGGTSELLYPRLGTNEVLCGGAGGYFPDGEPVALNGAASPLLNLAHRVIEPAVNLLSPQPLHAMYFAGRGLGGRTTSFSNFAPVDPLSLSVSPETATISVGETVQLTPTLTDPLGEVNSPVFTWSVPGINRSVTVDPNGLVTGTSEGIADVVVEYAGLSATSSITVTAFPPVVDFETLPDGTPVTGGQTISDEYSAWGLTFSEIPGNVNCTNTAPQIWSRFPYDPPGSTNGFAIGNECSVTTLTVDLPGGTTYATFELTGNNDVALFDVWGVDATGARIPESAVSRTSVVYLSQGGTEFRTETITISAAAITQIRYTTNFFLYLFDNLDLTDEPIL